MDKLQVLQMSEEKGGKERRESIEKLMVYARNLGCQVDAGGGKVGGINFRYGSIGYAIMDVSTDGDVKFYAQPHPNKTAPEALSAKINEYLDGHEILQLKSHPIKCHGLLDAKVEDIPIAALIEYLELALQAVRDAYY